MTRHFHYTDGLTVIRISRKRRPSFKNIPEKGVWAFKELVSGNWDTPLYSEITWNDLKTLSYLGSVESEARDFLAGITEEK